MSMKPTLPGINSTVIRLNEFNREMRRKEAAGPKPEKHQDLRDRPRKSILWTKVVTNQTNGENTGSTISDVEKRCIANNLATYC